MTARETGIRLGKLAGAQRKPTGHRPVRKQEALTRQEKRRLFQLLFCGSTFLLLVALKLLLPASLAQIRIPLSQLLEQNMDVTEVFSSVGRAVSGEQSVESTLSQVYRAVFQPGGEAAMTEASLTGADISGPLNAMNAYAHRIGSVSGWLGAQAAAGTAAAVSRAAPEASELSDASAQVSGTPAPAAATMQLSSILYSGDNLPQNVSLEQAVLGFDYCTPVSGTLSSNFGYREHPLAGEERFHYGIDLAADTGTAIACFADGTVTAVGESSSYGNYLIVSHPDGYSTLYAHCSSVCVRSGAAVKRGEPIAKIGDTGLATGPHLHFEVHSGDTYLNPIYYVSLL